MTWEVVTLGGVSIDIPTTVHVRPVDDVLEHTDVECECLPVLELVRGNDGWGLRVVHAPIDGKTHDDQEDER